MAARSALKAVVVVIKGDRMNGCGGGAEAVAATALMTRLKDGN